MITPEVQSVIAILKAENIRRGRHRAERTGLYPLYFDASPPRPAYRSEVRLIVSRRLNVKPKELRYLLAEAAWSEGLDIVGHDVAMTDAEAACAPFQTFASATLPRWFPVLDYERTNTTYKLVNVNEWTAATRRSDTPRPDVSAEAAIYARKLCRALCLERTMSPSTAARALGIYDDVYRFGRGPGCEWVDHLSAARSVDGAVCLIAQPYLGDIDRRHFEGMLRAGGLHAAGSLFSPYYPRNASVVVVSNGPLHVLPATSAAACVGPEVVAGLA